MVRSYKADMLTSSGSLESSFFLSLLVSLLEDDSSFDDVSILSTKAG